MKIFGFKWVPAFCKTTRVKPDAIFRLNSNRSVPALLNLASKRPPFLGGPRYIHLTTETYVPIFGLKSRFFAVSDR